MSPISPSDEVKAAGVLISISTDEGRWRGMMAVFGRHPPHFAALRHLYGRALARTSPLAVSAYVDALTLMRCQTPGDERRKAVFKLPSSISCECGLQSSAGAVAGGIRPLALMALRRRRSQRAHARSSMVRLDYAVSAYSMSAPRRE